MSMVPVAVDGTVETHIVTSHRLAQSLGYELNVAIQVVNIRFACSECKPVCLIAHLLTEMFALQSVTC